MGNTQDSVIKKIQEARNSAASSLLSEWYTNPILNPDCGKAEPQYKIAGIIVYADGTNWNPGYGQGYYFYTGSVWSPLHNFTFEIPYIKVSDVKAAGTAGGTFTAGAWQTRTLNTEDNDTGNIATLAANQITLLAGTYECMISAPASTVDRHKAKLRNITAGEDTLIGTSEYARSPVLAATRSFISGRFTIAAATVFEVQHYCQTTCATTGFGEASNFAVSEVYTVAEFWKVA